jgi:mono/diheme cytochrome c family protein
MASRTRSSERSFNRFWNGCIAACLVVAGVFLLPASGEPPAAPAAADAPVAIDFERQIRPLLVGHCGDCHGPDTQESHLRLDVKHRAMKGGDFGPVIVAGKSGDSELIRRITSTDDKKRMPPDGDRLSAAEIALLEQWIDLGATWPESEADRLARETDRDPRLDHWAWQPVGRPTVPPARQLPPPDGGWLARNEIDRFIQFKLADRKLTPAPEADRRTLIRRLSFDILGLPPTPEDVAAFIADDSPDAYEKLVDRLLASPHYGERWARHWLDIAHYADTHGFERDQLRPNAWRYRDWVIKALNTDVPYDEFLRRQIAGDVVAPDDADAVIATGFLTAGPWDFVGQIETKSDVLRRQARADDLDDMITQVMTSTCGVTINCARCHDHKLDPIPQREYYALTAVFAGVQRQDRGTSAAADRQYAQAKADITAGITKARVDVHTLAGKPIDLADIVGGGDGRGTGKKGFGIDPRSGKVRDTKAEGFLGDITVNKVSPGPTPLVNAVFIPNGPGDVPVSTTGLVVKGIPETSVAAWDVIRNGPVNQQFSTKLVSTKLVSPNLGEVDYAKDSHTILGLHANAGITFDLAEIAKQARLVNPRFRGVVGYGGRTAEAGADFFVFIDGEPAAQGRIGFDDGGIPLDIPLPPTARFLTLVATDAGNSIGMDQIFFGDARIEGDSAALPPDRQAALAEATTRLKTLESELKSLKEPDKVFGPVAGPPPTVKVNIRGNPETTGDEVAPGTISAVAGLSAACGDAAASDGDRRKALADWITAPANPLTSRVLVNRLWHHHFGTGLVDTPSDFGLGGGKPSHPELLDWLAAEFIDRGWSLKAMHRLICTSHTYRQRCVDVPGAPEAAAIDADNRLLWRQNARRLDAESLRDATLAVTGCLNPEMEGPGYRDFDYEEAYAPVYRYVTPDKPELWRRSIYRFIVRSTPHAFLTTLDCPNPANLTPARLETTTALQSLALLNNDFMLRQAGHWAARLEKEAGADPAQQVRRAYSLALVREPDETELAAAVALVKRAGLPQFCRMLFNANEFIYVD